MLKSGYAVFRNRVIGTDRKEMPSVYYFEDGFEASEFARKRNDRTDKVQYTPVYITTYGEVLYGSY